MARVAMMGPLLAENNVEEFTLKGNTPLNTVLARQPENIRHRVNIWYPQRFHPETEARCSVMMA